ncbi:carbohydrate ABC transporter permease [Micromonospora sp. AMSO1212t]|uniref:carbohydrate ABC transporter permease n=1 Tax=Micromonospora sp. AMSO1212t TaxID=2650565 RepID=UPI00124BC225|nr:carbohydrate ABC transporter permease [Micromonospora sp. AMSO1212t]KAB1909275.1 carbohydrate ABC transporter permease [Micromonospora sp. AMSO1212t]
MTTAVAPSPMRQPPRRVKPRPSARRIILAVIAYAIAALFLLPYLEMVVAAARPSDQLKDPNYLPSEFDWSNFVSMWTSGLGANLWISLQVAAGATLVVLLVALPAAYYTARYRFRGRMVFLLLVLVTQMFQPTAMLVGIYREFVALGLNNSVLGLTLVNAGFNLAFATWILNAYISSIPPELEEAATVDGSSRLGALFRITLPLAWPGIVTALIFTFISAWNEFVVALILTSDPEKQPLTVVLDSFLGGYQIEWGQLFAASVVATIPVIILFALIERKVVGGLTAGSVK